MTKKPESDGEPIKLEVKATFYPGGPLRLRTLIGESQMPDGKKVEVSMCVSSTAIYFIVREEAPRQVAVPIQHLLQSVGEYLVRRESDGKEEVPNV